MPVTKGYRSYRGRPSKGKIALAVVLVLVILAALAVIVLQEYVVYDAEGQPRVELPWFQQESSQTTQEEEPLLPENVEIIIQEPETPAGARILWLTDTPLAGLSGLEGLEDDTYDAVAVTVKDSSGSVYYGSDTAVSGARKADTSTDAVLSELTGGSYYTIARLSCLLDPIAARADVEGMGLKNTGGYIFYDGNNLNWLDPAKEAARQYLISMAKELAEMGFDEILLTDVSYPTEGKLDKIAYGVDADQVESACAENIRTFLEEMQAALEPYGVTLSVELSADVITTGADATAGLVLTDIAPLVDRVYARTIETEVQTLSDAVTAAGGALFIPELAALPQEQQAYLVEAS